MIAETSAAKDLRLWQAWKSSPSDANLAALLANLAGVVGSAVNTYRAAPLPFMVLELEAKRMAIEACKEWSPTGGTSLSTYVGAKVRQDLFRYVGQHQNVARIPEHQIRQIGGYNRAVSKLTDKFGREPNTIEVADYMAIPVKHVAALRKSLRQDLLESEHVTADDMEHDPNYERAILGYYSLTDQEKAVFDMSTGSHGAKMLSPGDMAKKLNVSGARVSALKEQIGKKLSPYLHG